MGPDFRPVVPGTEEQKMFGIIDSDGLTTLSVGFECRAALWNQGSAHLSHPNINVEGIRIEIVADRLLRTHLERDFFSP